MAKARRLTARFVKDVAPPKKGYELYPDLHQHGLKLRVMACGSRSWIQRISIGGKRTNIGLGRYPVVSLAEAREKAFANRKLVEQGGDPLADKRKAKAPTLKEYLELHVERQRPGWKTDRQAKDFVRPFKSAIFPRLGNVRIDAITTADLLKCMGGFWTAKPATAKKLLARLKAVYEAAIAEGHTEANPAASLGAILPKHTANTTKHHKAVPVQDIPAAMTAVRQANVSATVRLCGEFQVLTATRPSEARLAEWGDVDLSKRLWTIPAAKMKQGREHIVPLSDRAIEILREAEQYRGDGTLVFPSERIANRPFSDRQMSRLYETAGVDATAHGTARSSFRDWCAEGGVDRQVAEAALAHVVGGVEGAYLRSDLLKRRVVLMQRWADFVMGRGAEAVQNIDGSAFVA